VPEHAILKTKRAKFLALAKESDWSDIFDKSLGGERK